MHQLSSQIISYLLTYYLPRRKKSSNYRVLFVYKMISVCPRFIGYFNFLFKSR